MTDDQINAAIAKACGWRKEDGVYVWNGNGIDRTCWELWDYCNDLNAMHEAEMYLTDHQLHGMLYVLTAVCLEDADNECMHINSASILRATARQRAEALLRTLGKWEEAE